MRIALMGYGKMGKTIERLALSSGDEVVLRIDSTNKDTFTDEELKKADVAIEFTRPDQAIMNIIRCMNAGIPVVTGTTGWYDRLSEVRSLCETSGSAVFYASNFSIGVHLFFAASRHLARLMKGQAQYGSWTIHESHHVHKVDAPSGTAITLAEQLIDLHGDIRQWQALPEGTPIPANGTLPVFYSRVDEVPGTHTVRWESAQDRIEITHTAHNREGFASGALTAARWLQGRKGVFSMDDLLVL